MRQIPYMRLAADLARFAAGESLDALDAEALAEHQAREEDIAREGDGTLLAQAIMAEIAVDDQRLNRRAVREALADTQDRLHVPGRVFA